MSNKFPGIFETYRLANTDPVQLFQKIGYQQQVKVRRRGLQNFVTLTEPEHIHHALVSANANYIKAPALRVMWKPLLGNGLLTSSGDHWKKHRKTASPAFRSHVINDYAGQISNVSKETLADWTTKAATGQAIDLNMECNLIALKFVSTTLLSNLLTEDDISQIIKSLGQLSNKARFRDLAGLTPYLPRKLQSGKHEAIKHIRALALKALNKRKQNPNPDTDFINLFLTGIEDGRKQGTSNQDIVDEITTLIMAGFETTGVVLSCCLYLLTQMPEQYKKIIGELDLFAKGADIHREDLQQLPALKQYIDEVMRLYPPVPVYARQAVREDEIGGVLVPKGAIVEANIWLTHRHPEHWQKPLEFMPERFHPAAMNAQQKLAYIPFSTGARSCIGKNLALMEIPLFLATILKDLSFKAPQNTQMNFNGAIVLRPQGPLQIYPVKRTC